MTIEASAFVLLAYIACRNRVPWKAIGIIAAVTFLVLVPLNAVYRQALRGESLGTSAALSQAISSPYAQTNSPTNPTTYVFTRFRMIDNVALIEADTPSLFPFANGANYYELPAIVFVPRALWPAKPALTEGADFSRSYWQITQSSITTSTPLTQIGDLYRNFGLLGLIIGMVVWGLAIGFWQTLRYRWTSPVFAVVFLYSILYYVVYVESDLPALWRQR